MNAKPPIWVVLRAHLVADPRKTGALAVLFLVMVVIYARLFLGSSAPETAQAAAAPAAVVKAAPAAPPVAAPALVRIRPGRPLVRELERDPFAIRLDRFAPDPEAAAVSSQAAPSPADAAPPAREQAFLLQSTICGSLPMAWINGRCVRLGESIDGFVLERVEPDRVVLRNGYDERVLTMD